MARQTYRQRIERALARGKSLQEARGHKPGEHVERKLGGARQLRIAGELETVRRTWLQRIKDALGRALGRGGGQGRKRGERTGPVPSRQGPGQATERQETRADAAARSVGALTAADRKYVRGLAARQWNLAGGESGTGRTRAEYVAGALEWAGRAGIARVREYAALAAQNRRYRKGGGARRPGLIESLQDYFGEASPPDETWWWYG